MHVISILEYFILQIVAVTTDNASNNKTMMQILANTLRRYYKFFTASRQVLCFAHIMNLVVQASMKTFNVRPKIQDEVNAFEDTPLTLNVNDFVWTNPANVHNEDDEEGSREDEDGESSEDDLVPDEDTQEHVHDDTPSFQPSVVSAATSIHLSERHSGKGPYSHSGNSYWQVTLTTIQDIVYRGESEHQCLAVRLPHQKE